MPADWPLNKGRGNIPPSRKASWTHRSRTLLMDAQQRKGEYSPFKLRREGDQPRCEWRPPLNKGRGNIPPSSVDRTVAAATYTHDRSTKEGGIFPLQVTRARSSTMIYAGCGRSTKEGGIFPLQDLWDNFTSLTACSLTPRSTKEGGIFPLQALLLRYVTIRGRNGPTWPRYARTGYIREKLSMKFSRSTAGSQDSHRIHGLPVWWSRSTPRVVLASCIEPRNR